MPSAAIYARISKDREADGLGVERQRKDCEALAERLGWTVVATYVDDDRSAYSGKPRPQYRELLSAIESGAVGAVVAWHPDRLHRSPRELEGFIDLVERTGTAIQTVTAGAYDLTTPTGRMQARIVGAVARHESEHKAERIRRKMDELTAAGQPHVGGTRPFGLRRVVDETGRPARPVAYEVVESEAALIREATAAILDDGRSLRGLAAAWTARGVLSPTGKPWKPAPLRRMLCSAQLAGLRERHVDRDPKLRAARRGQVELLPANLPAILPRDRWQALRVVLRDPARRTTPSNARVNLLPGLVYCSRCGTPLVGRPRVDGVRRYVCASGPQVGGCGKIAILAEPAEIEVVSRVLALLDDPRLREALTPEPEVADPMGERGQIEARMAELAAAYAGGDITRAEWQAARSTLAARLADYQTTQPPRVPAVPPDVRAAWPGLDLDRQRAVLAAVATRITVGPAVRGRNQFDPTRIKIEWRA